MSEKRDKGWFMSESPVHDDGSLEGDAVAFQTQFEALEIPHNIDPHLLALWMQREQEEIERKQRKYVKPPAQSGRNLNRLFPAYIGITVMCLSIILGLVQRLETTAILQMACIAFLIYTIIGFFVGIIAERCVNNSVETLLRDIVKRSRESGQNSEPADEALN
jgi:hypothetical protein